MRTLLALALVGVVSSASAAEYDVYERYGVGTAKVIELTPAKPGTSTRTVEYGDGCMSVYDSKTGAYNQVGCRRRSTIEVR